MTRAVEPGSMLSAGSTVLTLSLTRPVWVRAYIDEPTSARRSRAASCCSIPMVARTSPITAKSALSPDRRIHAENR
jgi:HlyD family secretion protein